jgi:phosphoribosyl-ATP pyrophosphohydrolase/phosphoribosyl-AMP cyclohydrolase
MSSIEFIDELEKIIQARLATHDTSSYTTSLADAGVKRVAQKVGEEAIELALAAAVNDRSETIDEAADLIYHVLVLLNLRDITMGDVAAALEARHR